MGQNPARYSLGLLESNKTVFMQDLLENSSVECRATETEITVRAGHLNFRYRPHGGRKSHDWEIPFYSISSFWVINASSIHPALFIENIYKNHIDSTKNDAFLLIPSQTAIN